MRCTLYNHMSLNQLQEPWWKALQKFQRISKNPRKSKNSIETYRINFLPKKLFSQLWIHSRYRVKRMCMSLILGKGQNRGSNNITSTWCQEFMLIYCIVILELSSWVLNVTVWSQGSPKLTLQQVMSGDWLVSNEDPYFQQWSWWSYCLWWFGGFCSCNAWNHKIG